MSDSGQLPDGVAMVAVDRVQPCPIQPRVNFSVDLIEQLASSMRAGRHQPLLEVEPAPGAPGGYQIVCGEQRWRAARAAGLTEVLVRIHRPLGYLERLEKQYEENRLRADLDPVEEAHCLTVDHTIRSIAVAEQLLREALIPFRPLADTRVTAREEFGRHLDQLKSLLVRQRVVTGDPGKSQISTTQNIYAHVAPELNDEAVGGDRPRQKVVQRGHRPR